MIVLIAGDDVENHASELLLDCIHRQFQTPDHVEGLLVGVRPGGIEVEVRKSGERLHVDLRAVAATIEAAGHEMPGTTLLRPAALLLVISDE